MNYRIAVPFVFVAIFLCAALALAQEAKPAQDAPPAPDRKSAAPTEEALLAEPVPAVVARIDGTPVTREDFLRLWSYGIRMRVLEQQEKVKLSEEDAKAFMEQLINEKVLDILSSKYGDQVTDAEVKADFEERKKAFPADTLFQEYLKKENLDEATLLALIRKRLVTSKFKMQMLRDVQLTPGEVRAEYDRLVKEGKLMRGARTADICHILITVKNREDESEWEKTRERIDEARARLLAGEDFAEVAKQVSEDPNAKSNGGFYPETAPGRMGEEFDSRMFSQSIDEVSEPFRTPAGWHLLKVIATHDKGPHLFKEVQQKLSAMMIEAKHREALLGVVSEARKKMKVEVLYTPRLAASEAKP